MGNYSKARRDAELGKYSVDQPLVPDETETKHYSPAQVPMNQNFGNMGGLSSNQPNYNGQYPSQPAYNPYANTYQSGYGQQSYQPQGYQPQGYQPQGYQPQGYQQPSYAQPVQGYVPPNYDPTKHSGYINPEDFVPLYPEGYIPPTEAEREAIKRNEKKSKKNNNPIEEEIEEIEESSEEEAVEGELDYYLQPPLIKRRNEWLANTIKGFTEVEYYHELVSIGLISQTDLDKLYTNTIAEYIELFTYMGCHLCNKKGPDNTCCIACFKRYIENLPSYF